MELHGMNILGPERSGQGSNRFRAVNPDTGEELETVFYEATVGEIEHAVALATQAFDDYRQTAYGERALFLEAVADEIAATGDALIERCMAETALPEARLKGERTRTVNQLKLFASVLNDGTWLDARIDTGDPGRQPVPKPDIRQMQVAMGPAGVFGASNFPLAFSVAGGDTASALAAGCPVIFKAHPLHPGTSEIVAAAVIRAAEKTGMPAGVFSMIHGRSNDVGMSLVRHPGIRAIGFTGSFRGGKALFDAANARKVPIPVYAEMGSVNPVFILPGAMKERGEAIARGMVQSFTLGVGQFCTNPGLILTGASKESEAFITRLGELAEGSPPGTMLSGKIRDNFLEGAGRLSGREGLEQLAGKDDAEQGNRVRARLFSTSGEVFSREKDLAEEVFGPSTVGVRLSGKKQMLDIAAKMEGHLTATIHGTEEDLAEYGELIRVLESKAGRLIFNGYPTGVEVCHSMVHGGPYPATTAPQTTSVGTAAIRRFSRPVCYQDFPQSALPDPLKNTNPLNIWRMVNGRMTRDQVKS